MSWPWRKALIGSVSVLAVIAVVCASVVYSVRDVYFVSDRYGAAFKRNLAEAMERSKPFRMIDLTPFEWDRMYMFSPYTGREQMEDAVGRSWEANGLLGYWLGDVYLADYPLSDESMHKLVFVKDGEVVLDITLDRQLDADFTETGSELTPEQARFTVAEKDGWKYVFTEAESGA